MPKSKGIKEGSHKKGHVTSKGQMAVKSGGYDAPKMPVKAGGSKGDGDIRKSHGRVRGKS